MRKEPFLVLRERVRANTPHFARLGKPSANTNGPAFAGPGHPKKARAQ